MNITPEVDSISLFSKVDCVDGFHYIQTYNTILQQFSFMCTWGGVSWVLFVPMRSLALIILAGIGWGVTSNLDRIKILEIPPGLYSL